MRQALVAWPLPTKGLPSVMTSRTSSVWLAASMRACHAAQAQPTTLTFLAALVGQLLEQIDHAFSTPGRGPRLRPWPQPCTS